jgi:LPXTG-motif cell wall-anchored protein
MARSTRLHIACSIALLVSACASQIDAGVSAGEDVPGFWWGLWHGFIFPWAWIGSLFDSDIAVYAVPNTGAWYDFGFFVGITVLGGGSWFSSKKRSN